MASAILVNMMDGNAGPEELESCEGHPVQGLPLAQ